GASYRTPVIVVSAGNDSNQGFRQQDARYNSPMCFAAIELGTENIIVVEAVHDLGGGPTRWPGSSIGGHVSAPGGDIWSTVSGGALYGARDGTSMAAAHVSGLVAYLYASEPYLKFWEVRDLLLSNTVTVGGGAQPRVDAWASVVDLDRVRGGNDVLKMMCDIDDGTPDGNQRVEYQNWTDYYEEDADGDDGIGDGEVDMSDFRRWRDWFLQVTSAAAELDGDPNHPKKDVNKNSEVESPADENVYPRGDFNGDGMLDEFSTAFVPGAIGEARTDLGVLQEVFDDPDYTSLELPDLLNSVDIEVDAARLLDSYASVTVEILKMPESELAKTRVLTPGEPRFVFTMPIVQTGYKVEVFAGNEEYEMGDITYPDEVGRDYMFRPLTFVNLDPRMTYLHICDDPGTQPAMIVRLVDLGIKPGDVLCLDAEGRFGTGSGSEVEDRAMGVFSSSNVLRAAGNLHRVPGAIDAGEDYATAPTFHCGEEATDIPQDFLVYDTIIRVPTGATHLFLSALDRKFGDNSDNNGDYGVQISIVRVPEFLVD
ncbi:MAG: S8 family serine peptidase, partial [Candidatus Latescibacterota bacterium]